MFLLPISASAENIYCSCVRSARSFGLELPKGNADQLSSNSIPTRGGGILLQYKDIKHIAVIIGWDNEGWYIREGNYRKCTETYRKIKFNSDEIYGFWKPKLELSL